MKKDDCKKREQGEPEDRRRAQGRNRNSVLLTSQRANQQTSQHGSAPALEGNQAVLQS